MRMNVDPSIHEFIACVNYQHKSAKQHGLPIHNLYDTSKIVVLMHFYNVENNVDSLSDCYTSLH